MSHTDDQLQSVRDSIEHVQRWIRSGDRATDKELQKDVLGRDVFRWLTDYCDRLRAENERLRESLSYLRKAYSDAAREINCSGDVAHRIRVLKTHHGEQVQRVEAENERLKKENADLKAALGMTATPTIHLANGEAVHIGFVSARKDGSAYGR